MKRIILLAALILCLSVIGAIYVITTFPPEKEDVGGLSRVGVDGNNLVDEDNNIVTLRGVSIVDPYRACMHAR